MTQTFFPQYQFDVQTFYPRCRIIIYNEKEGIDVTPDVRQINTRKTLSNPYGIFSVQLTNRPSYQGKPPYEWIKTFDYIEIEMWNAPSDKHYYMRGFVENIQRIFTAGDNGPNTYTQINGRDLAVVLDKNQVRYIWQIDPASIAGNPFNAESNYGVGLELKQPTAFFKEIMTKLVNDVAIGNQKARIPAVPEFTLITDVSDQYSVNTFTVQNFTGPYWNILSYYASAPFTELFYIDTKDGPKFYFRQPPLKDFAGNDLGVFEPTTARIPDITVPLSFKKDHALGKSSNEMYAFYFVYSDIASTTQDAGYTYFLAVGGEADFISNEFVNSDVQGQLFDNLKSVGVKSPSNPTYDKALERIFGFKPLTISTPLISDTISTDQLADKAVKMCNWLYRSNRENYKFESGTLTLHGDGAYQIGAYLTVKGWEREYYVESIDHQFTAYQPGSGNTWISTLGVTRGRPV